MAIGHITMDGKPYVLSDPRQLRRSNANEVSAKIGSSAGDYDDLQEWSAFVMDDWRVGVGQKDASGGGTLFSTVDTRFEKQFLPAQKLSVDRDNGGDMFGSSAMLTATTEVLVGSAQAITRIGSLFQLSTTQFLSRLTILLPEPSSVTTATQAKVEIWSDLAGMPNAMLQSMTVTLKNTGFIHNQHLVTLTSKLGPPGVVTNYHVVVYPVSGNMSILSSASGGQQFNGTVWSSGRCPWLSVNINADAVNSVSRIVCFDDHFYMAKGVALVRCTSAGVYDTLKSYAVAITDLLPVGDTLYIGLGSSTNYDTMSVTYTFTGGTVPAETFAMYRGVLWRSIAGDSYYTADGTNWQIVQVGYGDSEMILEMRGFGDDMIFYTTLGLRRVAFGDVVMGITTWDTHQPTGGTPHRMCEFQGNLYIAYGPSLLRYDGASILPMGVDLGEGLIPEYSGNVSDLVATKNWMLMGVNGATYSSVWAHNGQGWHCMAVCPIGSVHAEDVMSGVSTMYGPFLAHCHMEYGNTYFASSHVTRIVCGPNIGFVTYRIQTPDGGRSLYLLDSQSADQYYSYEPVSVLYTDWFYGGLREIQKDFESVFADGDGISSTRYLAVWWQDEGSGGNWEFLGNITANGQELRWSNAGTRPNTRRFRLKVVLWYTTGLSANAVRINAIRVKYRSMIRDRYRWDLQVIVNEDQVFLDGDLQVTYTVAQQITNLDGLCTQVPPFVYVDTDGTSYDVMITNHVRAVIDNDFYNGAQVYQYVYNLTLEQVHV